ncbi:unnamed protein product, partial [Amoebophrya sp. A25]
FSIGCVVGSSGKTRALRAFRQQLNSRCNRDDTCVAFINRAEAQSSIAKQVGSGDTTSASVRFDPDKAVISH